MKEWILGEMYQLIKRGKEMPNRQYKAF